MQDQTPPAATQAASAPAGLIETDALIIGAGPVGLFQVFELGLQEIKAHVVDSLPHPGGQPMELYPDKPIYDIPALAVCTGRELTEALLKQIEPFGATFHLNQTVSTVEQQDDGRFFVQTSQGTGFLSRTLFIAAGVGAFEPRTLKVEGIDAFEGSQLFYRIKHPADLAGRRLLIVGGDEVALEWALHFASEGPDRASQVVLLHRRETLKASPAQLARLQELCESGQMAFRVGQITGLQQRDGRLLGVQVMGSDASVQDLPTDTILAFLGLSPRLGPIADWGLEIARKQLLVDTEKFSTSVPGIFAVGDINSYPGKRKLILSGFHECALAAFAAAAMLFPERGHIALEYTTSSTRLHKLLGVGKPAGD